MKKSAGFTLIELMLVIAIIGILAAVAVPRYMDYSRKAKAMEAKVLLGAIRTNQKEYYSRVDSFTTSMASLGNPVTNAQYYTFVITTSVDDYTATATPSSTGTAAGLEGVWTVNKSGIFGGSAVTSGNNF